MGNSRAYPILRNSRPADTYALAQLMPWQKPTVLLAAELQTAEDVLRMADVRPNAHYEAEGAAFDPERWSHEYRAGYVADGYARVVASVLPGRRHAGG
ncbi:hypothetical protein AB5J55_26065 [Streptomyces sp. R11]|uniref:Uncharacterized protein n=1 Tax=Streptomyces sp. R11 TaxID=3238625 RepID=A0AB39N7F2_9ACTN